MRFVRLAGALALALGVMAAPARAEAQNASDAQAAELMEQGDWAKAASVLRSLVDREPTATRLFNLGQAERNLGRLLEAKRRFREAVSAAKREKLEAVGGAAASAERELAARIARIELSIPADVDDPVVRIDGREIEAGSPVEVDPGQRSVLVTAPGRRPFERSLTLGEGELVKLDVTLEPTGGSAPATAPPAPATREVGPALAAPSSAGPPWPVWALGGVGVAALAGGVAFHFVADSKYDEAGSACRADGDRWVCPTGLEADARHRELKDDGARAETLRNVLFAVGAGAIIAGGVWWALSPGSKNSPEVGVAVGPESASARVRVPFF